MPPTVQAPCWEKPPAPRSLLRRLHDHTHEQVQPRRDGVELDVFGLLAVYAPAHEAEALDDDRLSGERGERRVGSAALARVVDAEGLPDLRVDALGPLHHR